MINAPPTWPHCDGADCGAEHCSCECATCTTLPTLLASLGIWSQQLRSAQQTLDVQGADREAVARIAGRLLDMAETLERVAENVRGRFA